MTDEPVIAPDSAATSEIPTIDNPPRRRPILGAMAEGARKGARYFANVMAPIGAIFTVMGLAVIGFGFGAENRLGLHNWAWGGIASVLAFALYGAVIGGLIGFLVGVARWARGCSASSGLWARLNRPIGRRKKDAEEAIVTLDEPDPARRPREEGPSWLRRVIWFGSIAGNGAFIAACVAGLVVGAVVRRHLSASIASADRDDPNWRLKDILATREPVPDDQNGAIVVAKVVKMLPKDWPKEPRDPNPWVTEPGPLTKALEAWHAAEANVRLDDETADVLRAERDRHAGAVDLARTVANYRTGRHEIVIAKNPLATLLRETQETRMVCRLLELDAAVRAHDGDIDGALESCRAMLATGRSIGDEPTLISGLVRVACGGVAMQSIRRALGQGEASDDVMARLQDLALDEMAQPIFLQGMRGERGMLDEVIRRIADSELAIDALSDSGKDDPARLAPWSRPLFLHQRAVALDLMQGLVELARHPAHERAALRQAWEQEYDRIKRQPGSMYLNTFAILMLPASEAADAAQARYEAMLDATALVLAAERQRRRTGHWPDSLDAIDPAILTKAPLDPNTGEPFLLNRDEDGFHVYTVGPNGIDEDGDYQPKLYSKHIADDAGNRAWDVALRRQPPGE